VEQKKGFKLNIALLLQSYRLKPYFAEVGVSVVQAVKWPHFFAKPVFIPIINRNDALGLAGYLAAKIGNCKPWRLLPKAAKFTGTTSSHDSNQFLIFGIRLSN
jgi:hypothetical protein